MTRTGDRAARSSLDKADVLTILGAACVALGVGAIHWPAGLIVAGLELVAGSLLVDSERKA